MVWLGWDLGGEGWGGGGGPAASSMSTHEKTGDPEETLLLEPLLKGRRRKERQDESVHRTPSPPPPPPHLPTLLPLVGYSCSLAAHKSPKVSKWHRHVSNGVTAEGTLEINHGCMNSVTQQSHWLHLVPITADCLHHLSFFKYPSSTRFKTQKKTMRILQINSDHRAFSTFKHGIPINM